MGGMFGGALVAMRMMGEVQSRLEYELLAADEYEAVQEAPAPVHEASGWRRRIARGLVALGQRIAPDVAPARPTPRLDPCPC